MKNTILLVFSSVIMLIFMAINNSVYPDMRGHYAITLLIVVLYNTHNAINYYFNNKPKKLRFQCPDGSVFIWSKGKWALVPNKYGTLNSYHTLMNEPSASDVYFINYDDMHNHLESWAIYKSKKLSKSYIRTLVMAQTHIDAMQLND